MVSHADDQDGASGLVKPTEAILAGGVYLGDDFFVLRDEVWPVLLVPFDPVAPHLYDLLLIELPRDTEAGHRVHTCVKFLPF